jgi:hypothetical protein
MASPRLIPRWTLSHPSFNGFASCIFIDVPLTIKKHLIVALTSLTRLCYLLSRKATLEYLWTLGCLLLSVTTPCRERKPIARLVNFLLTFESVQLKSYSLGEACLKVSLPDWWALLNYSLALNCVSSSRRFSSQYCKIESACHIGLARVFHSWPSSEQDGVLLEIRNQNEESYLWSLVATTSCNMAIISLPRCQTLFDTSITMFVPSPFVVTLDDLVCLLLWPSAPIDVLVIIDLCYCGFASEFECFLHPFCRGVVSKLTPHWSSRLPVLTDSRHVPNSGIKKVITPTLVSLRPKKWSPWSFLFS